MNTPQGRAALYSPDARTGVEHLDADGLIFIKRELAKVVDAHGAIFAPTCAARVRQCQIELIRRSAAL